MQGQQMPQRIDRRMNLRALAPLGPVVAGARSRFRRRLQRAAIENHRRRLRLASGKLAQQHAQILHHGFETARPNPTLRLLVDHVPRRQIVGHVAPLATGAHHVAKAVEHSSQRIVPLLRVLLAQCQVRCYKRPLLVRHIAGVTAPLALLHASSMNNPAPKPHPKENKRTKLITGSNETVRKGDQYEEAYEFGNVESRPPLCRGSAS